MRLVFLSACLAAIATLGSITTTQAKDTYVGSLGCDVTDRPKTAQNKDLEITCVFNPNKLNAHNYYMGNYTRRKGVPSQPAGVMHWEVFTSDLASFKGLTGSYKLNRKLSGGGRPPAFAVLVGGRKGAITLRPHLGHFNHERNFAGHVSNLNLIWGGR